MWITIVHGYHTEVILYETQKLESMHLLLKRSVITHTSYTHICVDLKIDSIRFWKRERELAGLEEGLEKRDHCENISNRVSFTLLTCVDSLTYSAWIKCCYEFIRRQNFCSMKSSSENTIRQIESTRIRRRANKAQFQIWKMCDVIWIFVVISAFFSLFLSISLILTLS